MNDKDRSDDGSLATIAREYLDDLRCRVSPLHFRNVKHRLEHTLASLQVAAVCDFQPVSVIRYRNHRREKGASNRTANLIVNSLSAMFSWAVGCGLVTTNPLRNVRPLPSGTSYQRYRRRALSDDEIERFLRAAEQDDIDTAARWDTDGGGRSNHRRTDQRIPQAPMWRTFLETGARWSELTRVKWGDLNCAQLTLVLRAENTKSRKRRVLPLRASLVEVLLELRRVHAVVLMREASDVDPVFRTPEAAVWGHQTNNAMRIFNRVLARATIARADPDAGKIDIHSLRHTFGSRLARNGVGLVHVQRLMGHSDPKLTAQVYTHLGVEDLRSAVAALTPT